MPFLILFEYGLVCLLLCPLDELSRRECNRGSWAGSGYYMYLCDSM